MSQRHRGWHRAVDRWFARTGTPDNTIRKVPAESDIYRQGVVLQLNDRYAFCSAPANRYSGGPLHPITSISSTPLWPFQLNALLTTSFFASLK